MEERREPGPAPWLPERLNVTDPCHATQEMWQRAVGHVDRCEKALKANMSDGINPSDGWSAGSI
jgi:hypothetical protein